MVDIVSAPAIPALPSLAPAPATPATPAASSPAPATPASDASPARASASEGTPSSALPPTPPSGITKRARINGSARGSGKRPRRKQAVLMGRLTYRWAVVRKPAGSRLRPGMIVGVRAPMGFFKPDVPGIYDLALHVRGHGAQYVDPVRIRVLEEGEAAPEGDECFAWWMGGKGDGKKEEKDGEADLPKTPAKEAEKEAEAGSPGSSGSRPNGSSAGSPSKPSPAGSSD